jgi:hypothetical protein
MRKTIFTKDEYEELKELISLKVLSDRNEQKKIRDRIRKIGFHFQDFSTKKGYTVTDIECLEKTGKIRISENLSINSLSVIKKQTAYTSSTKNTVLNNDPFEKGLFLNFEQLDTTILQNTGLYCIKIKSKSYLPDRYKRILDKQNHNIIYIGKAQGQSLRNRLNQEIYHTSPGTFFRSIGAVLGFTPIPGHLIGKSNKKNYKFSKEDTKKITDWLLKNTEFNICEADDFSNEKQLIEKYCPILNDTYNPKKLVELKEDRKKCREIALR